MVNQQYDVVYEYRAKTDNYVRGMALMEASNKKFENAIKRSATTLTGVSGKFDSISK